MNGRHVPSSFRLSCTTMNRIWLAVTNAETNHWLNLSIDFKYMLFVFHLCCKEGDATKLTNKTFDQTMQILTSSTKSSAAWAINWFKCLWSSFCQWSKICKRLVDKLWLCPFLHISICTLSAWWPYLYLFAAGKFHFEYWVIEVADNGEIITAGHFFNLNGNRAWI